MCSVEGATLDWIDRPQLTRDTMRELLVKTLGGAMRAIREMDHTLPGPGAGPPGRRLTTGSGAKAHRALRPASPSGSAS